MNVNKYNQMLNKLQDKFFSTVFVAMRPLLAILAAFLVSSLLILTQGVNPLMPSLPC